MKNRQKSAPKTLDAEARAWWKALLNDFAVSDAAGFLLLQTALEAFGTMRKAQALLETEGLVTRDKWGQAKPHPAAAIARDARAQMLAALKSLNFDIEPLKDLGRPGGS